MGIPSTERQTPCINLCHSDFADSRHIPSFKGSVDIGTLKVQRLDKNSKNTFLAKGQMFVDLTGEHRHREYDGFMIQRTDQDPLGRRSLPNFSSFSGPGSRSFLRSAARNDPQLIHFQVSP
jgi:hypothetical protein